MPSSTAALCPTVSPEPSAADLVSGYVEAAAAAHPGTLTIGLCGAQGSGKSTVAAAVEARLREAGRTVAVLSLDDLYLSREARAALAREVHPLFRTRGVPGTHNVALGEHVLERLRAAGTTALPRFDKAQDMPEPQHHWPQVQGPVDVILLEGWCVGARPEHDEVLGNAVNRLEQEEDTDGRWRSFVNNVLAGAYQALFARIDHLILLAAPGFDVVADWRKQQEHALRARLAAEGRGLERTMDDPAVERFVSHYERLTRHILREMPARADLTIRLDAERRVIGSTVAGRS